MTRVDVLTRVSLPDRGLIDTLWSTSPGVSTVLMSNKAIICNDLRVVTGLGLDLGSGLAIEKVG
jgi:hypothetical protein